MTRQTYEEEADSSRLKRIEQLLEQLLERQPTALLPAPHATLHSPDSPPEPPGTGSTIPVNWSKHKWNK